MSAFTHAIAENYTDKDGTPAVWVSSLHKSIEGAEEELAWHVRKGFRGSCWIMIIPAGAKAKRGKQ